MFKVFHKFKANFDEVPNLTIPSQLLDTSSRTTSDDEPRNRAFDVVLQESTRRDDLTAVPFESAAELNFNDHEPIAPLQIRSLFQSLQHNHDLSSNASLPSIESGTSNRALSDSSKSGRRTSISGGAIPVDTIRNSKFSSSFFKKSRNSVSSSSSVKLSQSSEENSFMPSTLPPDGFVSALSEQTPNDTQYHTVNDFEEEIWESMSPTTIAFESTNGRQVKEMPESTADSVEVVCPMEPISSTSVSVTQTSQTHDDSVIRISSRTVNDDVDRQPTSATNQLPDPPPYSLLSPQVGVPREIPLDGPSASPTVQSLPLNSTTNTFSDSNSMSPKVKEVKRKPSSSNNLNAYLLNLVTPRAAQVVDPSKTSRTLRSHHVNESNGSLSPDDLTPDNILARKMEELGKSRRMQLRSMPQAKPLPSELEQSLSSNAEPRPQLQTVQEDQSSDVATMLREAYVEQQHALRTQLDKTLADLQHAQAENKRLTTENKSQKRSISQLNIALDEAKIEKDQLQNQLHDATSSLTTLNREKKGWQSRLDSMQHKLNAAERQVRCLDHLTRHKLESRLNTHYNQPKRRKQVDSAPASPDVIALMRGLNEEIYQACVQLVDDLEDITIISTKHKPRVQKVLGDHLTEMMEDQAIRARSGYNVLLMQAVLEVFMTHWCSSIIEAFYPQQESFADLLVQLSTQTTRISSSTAICGKQIRVVQSTSHSVKFNDWVQDIIKDLGQILTIAKLRMKTQRAHLFSTKTLALVRIAYDLRTALAEKDICGGLEVVIIESGRPFEENSMIDAHADPRKVDTDHSHVDFVAGTSGIGLQRKVLDTVQGQFHSRMKVEFKPKVILTRTLQDYLLLKS